MFRPIATASALCLALALPATADPTVGFGFNMTFGGNTAPEVGLGLRVLSDDTRDDFAATIGLDYMLRSGRLRPTVGAAYLGSNNYIGVDMGYDFSRQGVDFSVGAGFADTNKPAASAPPVDTGGSEGGTITPPPAGEV